MRLDVRLVNLLRAIRLKDVRGLIYARTRWSIIVLPFIRITRALANQKKSRVYTLSEEKLENVQS